MVAHYDSSLETSLIVDASPEGLGAILVQKQKDDTVRPVYYASRALSHQEKKYSQTEREALAVVYGCERFHLYLYGADFTILSDHQPLKILYSHTGKPSPRILRWGLRLQSYSFKIVHIPGSINPADMLSIHPAPIRKNDEKEVEETEKYINSVICYAVPKALTLSEIIEESQSDNILVKLQKCISTGIWPGKDPQLRQFTNVKNNLTTKSGVILLEDRIVIPESLRKRTLDLAHETHMGIVKTKSLMRGKVWWPSMDKDIENLIQNCIPCLSVSDKSSVAPMQFTNLPMSKPWEKVHIDLCGPFPTGDSVLGIIDASSRWPELHTIRSTSSETIKNCLEKTFSGQGYPLTIVTDNAPNLTSVKIEEYCEEYAITHQKATPYWPQGNSEIERFYRTLGKFIRTTNAEGRDWHKEIHKFLLTYRNTPHCSTKVAPSVLLMNRKLRDKLPCLMEDTLVWQEACRENEAKKMKSKLLYDNTRHVKVPSISLGDFVLMRKEKKGNKLSTEFYTSPSQVVNIHGTAITVYGDRGTFTRNVADVKKIPNYTPTPSSDSNDDTTTAESIVRRSERILRRV